MSPSTEQLQQPSIEPKNLLVLSARASDEEIQEALQELPKYIAERFRKQFGVYVENNFERGRGAEPLYGDLDRGMDEDELCTLFSYIPERRFRLIFGLAVLFRLRVGDIGYDSCRGKGRSINRYIPSEKFLELKDTKTKDEERRPVPDFAVKYVEEFFELQEYSAHYLRGKFREFADDAGFKYRYGESTHGRTLALKTFHSLGHSGIQIFYDWSGADRYRTAKYARHDPKRFLGTTATYLSYRFEHLREDMGECFEELITELIEGPDL